MSGAEDIAKIPESPGPSFVLTTDDLLAAEAEELGNPPELAALCLSGGGIRSAAFALGVVQALARKDLLTHFHYLSTVSGGGYLGAWLLRWIEEEKQKHLRDDPNAHDAEKRALSYVQDALAGRSVERQEGAGATDDKAPECALERGIAPVTKTSAKQNGAATRKLATAEPAPIRWLRENSNFITPRVGLASADTWTAISMSIRNLLINWLVFVPALLFAVALPNVAATILSLSDGKFAQICLVIGTYLVGIASWQGARNLPSHVERRRTLQNPSEPGPERSDLKSGSYIFKWIALSATLGAAVLAAGVSPDLLAPARGGTQHAESGTGFFLSLTFVTADPVVAQALGRVAFFVFIGLVGGYFLAWIHSCLVANPKLREANNAAFGRNLVLWLVGSAAAAFVYVLGLALVPHVPCPAHAPACGRRVDVLATLAVSWGILSQLVLTVIFVAFRRAKSDEFSPDLDREWLARLSALKIRLGLAWTLFATAVLLFRHVIDWFLAGPEAAWQWATGAVGLVSGALAAFGGKSANTGYRPDSGASRRLLPTNILVGIATFLFLAILLVLFGRVEFKVAEWFAEWLVVFGQSDSAFKEWLPRGLVGIATGPLALLMGHILAMGGIAFALWFTSSQINVNRFSLNGFYRNRLARTFLGAARKERVDVDPFTNFAPSDNIRLEALKGRRALMPVINVALNLVGRSRLAWQERKAQSFVFTPLACGSAALGVQDTETGRSDGRYVRTHTFGGNEPDLGVPGKGVSLATAIAISGAAASPSMGYHSSPSTALVMALFNVRLGAWLPNPGAALSPAELSRSAPPNALLPLLEEMLGLTNERGSSVYLSDGGHFENLGLYEMVRRKCRYIIVSDAGCDPTAGFEDLGNAVRKIKIDLRVEIDVQTGQITSRNTWKEETSTYFALGRIKYPNAEEGKLLYVKPSCPSGLPADVRAYALKSEKFPHEPTVDQWFSESQFESYRGLGANLVGELGESPSYATEGLPAFFAEVDRGGGRRKSA